MITPHTYVLVSSRGSSETSLNAFDTALRNAGIADFNFVTVSSILPRSCRKGDIDEVKAVTPGSFMYCVMSRVSSNVVGETISTALACATTKETVGVVTESSGRCPSAQSERIAVKMSDEMVSKRGATLDSRETTSVEMNIEKGWGCCISICLLLY
mgnify:FL=1